MKPIPYGRQSITEEDIDAVVQTLRSDYLTQGPKIREFEDAFEYQLTPDQETAIEDVKSGMEAVQPMDRLIVGDVGYGKTEVAMRAAFKAVMEGKQTAVLAPTTVLVFQHYKTLQKRFSAFPARIEMLSRFRTAKEQREALRKAFGLPHYSGDYAEYFRHIRGQ